MAREFMQIHAAAFVLPAFLKKELSLLRDSPTQKQQNGKGHDAIELYYQMLKSGIMLDQFTFGSVVKACSGGGNVGLGRRLHAQVVKSEVGSHLIAQNALIAMHSKFDQIDDAWNIERPDLASWNAIIAGVANNSNVNEALSLFARMRHLRLIPDGLTVRSLLSACTNPLALSQGMQVHSYIIKMGFDSSVSTCNALLPMYAKCSMLRSAFLASIESHTLAETKMRFVLTVKFVLQINCPGKSCWQVLQFRLSVWLKSNLFVGEASSPSVSSFGLVEVETLHGRHFFPFSFTFWFG
ncbi:hypothetical protein Q3G72_015913 [Acer saccharum]|nr:hypothetical protein Q3G72_015913 [Acer saccharum]